jgi:hypothetical protein
MQQLTTIHYPHGTADRLDFHGVSCEKTGFLLVFAREMGKNLLEARRWGYRLLTTPMDRVFWVFC